MADVQTPTVLVVEDEQELRQLIVEALEKEGFAVAQCGCSDGLDPLFAVSAARGSGFVSLCPHAL